MEKIVLINGKKQSKLSVFDRLTQFGDGLFETCIVKDSKLLFWRSHFERLERGRNQLKINKVSEKQWLKDINKALGIARSRRAVVKLILSRGQSERGYDSKKSIKPTRIVIVSQIPEQTFKEYSLGVCNSGYVNNPLLANIKHCNRLEQILARVNMPSDECIMLDKNGFVISVTQGNIFGIKGNTLLTPNLDECGIQGTRRQQILQIAGELKLKIKIDNLSLQELMNCDEVFISNSVIGIKMVKSINAKHLGQREITQKIAQSLQKKSREKNNMTELKPKKTILKKALIILAIAGVLSLSYMANSIKTDKQIVYHLPQGASISATASNLEKQGVIYSRYFFIAIAKTFGFDSKIKSGYYDINPDMSVFSLLTNFVAAQVASRNITLIEGKTVAHYYQQLEHNRALKSSGSFAETMRLSATAPPFEGYFWPDTYRVNFGDSVASVLKRANQKLQKNLSLQWQNRAQNLRLKDKHQALTLASLIEKETANNAEKSQIAGVFMRRLKIKMPLQTDPTIAYALNLHKKYRGSLSSQDLKFNSPYNTYKNQGLPPTPIASVGAASLYAAMHPAKGDSLYFVSKKNGTHAFAKTYRMLPESCRNWKISGNFQESVFNFAAKSL
ncbi:MAG: endolytic transglycosylase MltG, partial [Candidatus Thioglobus sp.]